MTPDLKPGDRVRRIMPGFRGEQWSMDGEVLAVEDEAIIVAVFVDVLRAMKFDAKTLVNIHGRRFGWLEKMEECAE